MSPQANTLPLQVLLIDEMYRVPGSDFVISAGVYRGKTYGHMLHRTDYYALNIKNKNKSKIFTDFREWVDRFHEIDQNGVITIRETPFLWLVPLRHLRIPVDCHRVPRRNHLIHQSPRSVPIVLISHIRDPQDTPSGKHAVTADIAARAGEVKSIRTSMRIVPMTILIIVDHPVLPVGPFARVVDTSLMNSLR